MYQIPAKISLVLAFSTVVWAGPVGSFSGSFPSYTFTAACADPVGVAVVPGGPCNLIDIDYTATGSTTLFANAGINVQTLLVPFLPGPFPFTGTFTLTDLDNPADSVTGTVTAEGEIAGPPGPPVGFPPFVIHGLFATTGGTGAYAGASGYSKMNGTALFTFLTQDASFASGEGALTFEAVPEPGTLALALGAVMGWLG